MPPTVFLAIWYMYRQQPIRAIPVLKGSWPLSLMGNLTTSKLSKLSLSTWALATSLPSKFTSALNLTVSAPAAQSTIIVMVTIGDYNTYPCLWLSHHELTYKSIEWQPHCFKHISLSIPEYGYTYLIMMSLSRRSVICFSRSGGIDLQTTSDSCTTMSYNIMLPTINFRKPWDLYNGQNFIPQWWPLLRGSTVHVYGPPLKYYDG